ncbi:folliculin-interacting protein 1 [Fopius arisanus]|uniref:FNIP2 protein n=1 Tax=Fopius arisanus TaxID=64838 RepID=A0A0C9PRL2_9HYME|nr:PREDICTED: folliculin-interacting protein 1 [Fopius arisanus]
MPLINRLFASRKNIKTNADCKLPVDIGTGFRIRNTLNFGADQIRILLFRECEWRGRKLLFDSVTAGRNNESSSTTCNGANTSCPRSGNGLPHECEKGVCDNVNLLSEMVFGTVAMTYRGTLFKIHTLEFPRCIMCTKVFPAPDHVIRRSNDKFADDTLRISFLNNNNSHINRNDSISSNGSTRNTLSYPSSGNISGNISGNSLRKSSTSSSTCSGWDFEVPLFPASPQPENNSKQSLDSNSNSTSSSGFGSYPSLRRRWLRAVSTSLNHTDINHQMDDILGLQVCGDNSAQSLSISTCDDIYESNRGRHKTRLGLTIMIKLTPDREKEMELRLFEHASQLEAILDRLCQTCLNTGKQRGLIERLHQASFRCTWWLLRLLVTKKDNEKGDGLSIWHEIILNKSMSMDRRNSLLYRNFQQMCQLLDTVDTKSTNFFLSSLITAVLTYHLGWVNSAMSLEEKKWLEAVRTRYPCNPLWIQLSDLYGTLGNPSKRVHTIVTGDASKLDLIDGILKFLSYFIRSAIVKRHDFYRSTSGEDIQESIRIIEKKMKRVVSPFSPSMASASSSSSSSSASSYSSRLPRSTSLRSLVNVSSTGSSIGCLKKKTTETSKTLNKSCAIKKSDDSNIPRLKKTISLHRNLDLESLNCMKLEDKLALKLDSCQDDLDGTDKDVNNSSPVKIVVNSDKNMTNALTLDEFVDKSDLRSSQLFVTSSKTIPSIYLQNDFDVMKEVSQNANATDETDVYFSQIEYESDKQSQVFFTVGGDEKSADVKPEVQSNQNCSCQCSFAFTRVPSTSAQLPEGVLRKILQRNFPESSKSIQRPGTSLSKDRSFGVTCPKCNGSNGNGNYENSKLLLETPTNATEVLRTCGVSTIGIRRSRRADGLEKLLEDNNFIELPMPRSNNDTSVENQKEFEEISGYTDTLLQRAMKKLEGEIVSPDLQYTAGLIIQGLIKKSNQSSSKVKKEMNPPAMDSRLSELLDDISISSRYPFFDCSISETLCIVADIDNWQVGLISNTSPNAAPLPVGMSRLVSRMLEAFLYLWTRDKSSIHCFTILESKMREMWLRSGALAQMIMTMDVCSINLDSLTSALDLDAADVPLLLAVATTHSPQIAQRIGFTYT